MALRGDFARDIAFATKGISPEMLSSELAKFAKAELAKVIQSGQASPIYERYVNSQKGAPEESVKVPGTIVYVFQQWDRVIKFALEQLRAASPRRTGRYEAGHHVLVNNVPVTEFSKIDVDAEVVITNRQPYTRKIESGVILPGHVYDKAYKATRRAFQQFDVKTRFIDLPSPYILKLGGARRGRRAGDALTYPALILSMKE